MLALRVEGGEPSGTNPQAGAIVADIQELLEAPPEWVETIGIVVRGAEVASVQRAIFDNIDQSILEEYKIRVGSAYQFQGAQRDLMYLAMSDLPPEPGHLHRTLSFDSKTVNQMNVGTSRARQQQRVFFTCGPETYRDGDVRRSYLEHAIEADEEWDRLVAPGVPELVPEDERVTPFDSLSEQRVFNELVRRGFAVEPQVEAPVDWHRYRLDFVVHGPVGHVVVEYDGPHHDTPRQYLADLERKQDLVRFGWTVLQVHHSDFNRNRSYTIDRLVDEMRSHRVFPVVEWDDAEIGSEIEAEPDPPATADFDHEPVDSLTPEPTSSTDAGGAGSIAEPRSTEDPTVDRSPESGPTQKIPPAPREPIEAKADRGSSPPSGRLGRSKLAPYPAFNGSTVPPLEAETRTVRDGVIEIVTIEGPIMGGRIIQVYNTAAGGNRAGRNIRSMINRAITSADRMGLIVADNSLGTSGNKFTTYRLPEQPDVLERRIGPRSIHDIPPAELAARLRHYRGSGFEKERCYRAVLDEYQLTRLTESTRQTLDKAWSLLSD